MNRDCLIKMKNTKLWLLCCCCNVYLRLSKSPLFFLVGYAILKDFSYLFGANSPVENSTDEVMTIDQ